MMACLWDEVLPLSSFDIEQAYIYRYQHTSGADTPTDTLRNIGLTSKNEAQQNINRDGYWHPSNWLRHSSKNYKGAISFLDTFTLRESLKCPLIWVICLIMDEKKRGNLSIFEIFVDAFIDFVGALI